MPIIMLARHGQTDSNATGVLQGHLPVPLNRLGHEQALRLASRVGAMEPAVEYLVSSDLRRAVQTAEPIERVLGLTAELDVRWRERCLGSLEGKAVGETEVWKAAAGTLNPPGAEPIDEMADRVLGALTDLVERHGERSSLLVVTHGGVIRIALSLLASGRLRLVDGHSDVVVAPVPNASILHLSAANQAGTWRWRVVSVNDTEHLAPSEVSTPDAV